MRDAVRRSFGNVCHLCGEAIVRAADFTADHLKSVRAGGSTILGNLLPAHKTCNEFRGARPLTADLRTDCRRRYLGMTR